MPFGIVTPVLNVRSSWASWRSIQSGWNPISFRRGDATARRSASSPRPRATRLTKLVIPWKSVEGQIVMTRPAGAFAEGWPSAGSPTGAIVGARNARQVEGVMRAGELKLTPQDIAEIEG